MISGSKTRTEEIRTLRGESRANDFENTLRTYTVGYAAAKSIRNYLTTFLAKHLISNATNLGSQDSIRDIAIYSGIILGAEILGNKARKSLESMAEVEEVRF